MLKINGKYGDLNIEGRKVDIEKTAILELKKYLEQLDKKEKKLIEKQNQYLSEILN